MKNTLLPWSGSSQSHCWKKTCHWQPIIRASRKSSRGRLTKKLLAGKDGWGPVIYKGRRATWKSLTLPHKPLASRWCFEKQRRKESWWIPDSLWLEARPPACTLWGCPRRVSGASSASCLSHTPQTQGPSQSIIAQCYSMTLEGTTLCLAMQKHLSNYKQTPTKTHGEEHLESKYVPTGWDHFISHYIWFFKCWFLLYL